MARNPRFYLLNAKTPGAAYKVLWYRVSSNYTGLYVTSRRSIKVDILLPGAMDIPYYPSSEIVTLKALPAAPLKLLLLLKLQAWSQHRAATEFRFRSKAYTDASDLQTLISDVLRQSFTIIPLSQSESGYISDVFMDKARERVEELVKAYPDKRKDWEKLGFVLKQTNQPAVDPFNTGSLRNALPSIGSGSRAVRRPGTAGYVSRYK